MTEWRGTEAEARELAREFEPGDYGEDGYRSEIRKLIHRAQAAAVRWAAARYDDGRGVHYYPAEPIDSTDPVRYLRAEAERVERGEVEP